MAGDLLSYDTLKAFAWKHGFHAETHRDFDSSRQRPGREQAMWYLQPSIKQSGEATRTTILKFALSQEVYDYILEFKRANGTNQ
jgi:hypothetical protein